MHTPIAARFQPFGSSIFAEMSALAQAHGAINLSQGFPDFDGPDVAKEAAIAAIRAGHAQYARMAGVPLLNAAVARSQILTSPSSAEVSTRSPDELKLTLRSWP